MFYSNLRGAAGTCAWKACFCLSCRYLIHTNRLIADPWPSGRARFTPDLCHYPPATSQGRQSRDQGRPGEILSPDIKKGMHAVISPPHCQEFNFTPLTSARDKCNINNVIHSEREGESSGLFPGQTLTRPLIMTMTCVPNILDFTDLKKKSRKQSLGGTRMEFSLRGKSNDRKMNIFFFTDTDNHNSERMHSEKKKNILASFPFSFRSSCQGYRRPQITTAA